MHEYDPGRPDTNQNPLPAEFVICLDVLEHVEPDHIDAVLDDLKRVVLKRGIFNIALKPALRALPDGRNAHILLQPSEWWKDKLEQRFKLLKYSDSPYGVKVLVERLP